MARESINQATKQGGIHDLIMEMPQGLDTILGRVLGNGVDLSGGQWQKVAITRALFRDTPIVILDEPTASLDPMSEFELFNKFKEISKDKTTIFISHRMASVRMADKIIVMKEGEIVEYGTHEELIEIRGEYSKMFNAQAQWYISKEVEQCFT